MLIKTDHITLTVGFHNIQNVTQQLLDAGFILKFSENGLINPKAKKRFMRYPENDIHDMYFWESNDPKYHIPIEVISYASVEYNENNRTYSDTNMLQFNCCEPKKVMRMLYTAVNGKIFYGCNYYLASVKGFLDKTELQIKCYKSENSKREYLDSEGYNCPTFIVSEINETYNILASNGFIVSEKFDMVINGRELLVFYATSANYGFFIEFVSEKGGKND